LDGISRRLDGVDLFPKSPVRETSTDYRRWAFESAALDLALRQAGISLGEALGESYRPVRFVVSTRLDPWRWLELDPALEFKLDPEPDWTPRRMRELAATDRVRVLDYKGHYSGTPVDLDPDPELYRQVAEAFPEAILEDPAWNDRTAAALAGHEGRLSWDAPVHSVEDLDALPVRPRFLNVKPSRFGTLRRFLDCLDVCRDRGIVCYGGGQFELGPGRGQIQALASLFYPNAPNDVAPKEYNAPEPVAGLPASPLLPPALPKGLGFS
jgi:L-alanine-DL-glutamate epimerase-like enolase superfamily enzyme